MELLGIDIGGSGIKAALVDTAEGKLTTERYRVDTPEDSSPQRVAEIIGEVARHFAWQGPIGCGFPGVVQHGSIRTAANVSKSWMNVHAEEIFSAVTGCPVRVVNDADAAGLAENRFGAVHGQPGITIVLTVGTGIGSAIVVDGVLLPNTELGHLKFRGESAERYASDAARKREDLSWKDWTRRLNEYLAYVYSLFYPDRFVLGGGVSKKFDKIEEYLQAPCPVYPALLKNEAGIVGAALSARDLPLPPAAGAVGTL